MPCILGTITLLGPLRPNLISLYGKGVNRIFRIFLLIFGHFFCWGQRILEKGISLTECLTCVRCYLRSEEYPFQRTGNPRQLLKKETEMDSAWSLGSFSKLMWDKEMKTLFGNEHPPSKEPAANPWPAQVPDL
jgi:hypothetical protein